MQPEIKKSVTVNVLGSEYVLKGSSTPEQIQEASEYVDLLLKKLLKTNSHVNQQKLLVLTCINLADELIKLKQELASKNAMNQMKIQQESQGQKAASQQNVAQQRIFQQNNAPQKNISQQQNVAQQRPVQQTQPNTPQKNSSQAGTVKQVNPAQGPVQQNTPRPDSTPQPNPNQQKPNH